MGMRAPWIRLAPAWTMGMQHNARMAENPDQQLMALIERVADAARARRVARIVVKVNALTDPGLIHALLAAGQAGASIDLIVRGACMLPPGLPGVSENIRVRSVVGRFLEHTRIVYFRWGASDDDEVVYLSSADWMSRNMFRRIEVAWPVRDPVLRQRVIEECLTVGLSDTRDAWVLLPDGRYVAVSSKARTKGRAKLVSGQSTLMERHGRKG